MEISLRQVPLWAWAALALAVLAVYAVGFGQSLASQIGHTGAPGFLHELFHDGRHLLGFPCH